MSAPRIPSDDGRYEFRQTLLAEALDVIEAANSSDPYESFPWSDLEPILRKHGRIPV